MTSLIFLLLAAVSAGTLHQAWGTNSMTALYGETIVIPCNRGAPAPEDLMFIKWKYEKADGTLGDLLIKQTQSDEATIQATDDYAKRVSIDDNFSLHVTQASLNDQNVFTCMVVSESNLAEYPVDVIVHKKPSSVEVMDKAVMLQKDKLTAVGTCVAASANPAAVITWKKDGKALVQDGKATQITSSMKIDPATGLSTTSSTLQYAATKEDGSAIFTCMSVHNLTSQDVNVGPFPVHYPSENIVLRILPQEPILEGYNVTLKCHGDGNPPPKSFYFTVKGKKTQVTNSDNYTLTNVTREAKGEYKCSLVDNEALEDSKTLNITYLDVSLSSTGKTVKTLGEPFSVEMDISTSSEIKALWKKDGTIVDKPNFENLTYAHAGTYVWEVSVTGIKRSPSFELVVEGEPVITGLLSHYDAETKERVLSCEAEGVPQPTFKWDTRTSDEKESTFTVLEAPNKISVAPDMNLTVTCTVENKLGTHTKTITVYAVPKDVEKDNRSSDDDHSKVIVGVVLGLLAVAMVAALLYWVFTKRSRQGSWKIDDKEDGTPEENAKLDNNHAV
ncbi:CD166 antigen homolog [Mugil cephalus]|uniref:CD166 antigen homolog n=1 Tax=Mugil cephalus TaxID=48193 RepID=UPI001FB66F29|nr:CD166 antigen homolog [Mugil cephalus]XP_047463333.1 CD166 antigen homolog [Mugil cephalus]XP_047463334.1 CD166 antigen homolog [Mugil cephalus]XP_047463335.1 CD166 antigen homolog [Mugil cephalus]